jgi:hypothetical protein
MSLFFYTRRVSAGTGGGKSSSDKIYTDSFNLNKVIRSVQMDDNKVLVLLDDVHERPEDVPEVKNGKVIGQKRVRNVFQTEINLFDEDATRFNNLGNK